jgi:hypothetical protein
MLFKRHRQIYNVNISYNKLSIADLCMLGSSHISCEPSYTLCLDTVVFMFCLYCYFCVQVLYLRMGNQPTILFFMIVVYVLLLWQSINLTYSFVFPSRKCLKQPSKHKSIVDTSLYDILYIG